MRGFRSPGMLTPLRGALAILFFLVGVPRSAPSFARANCGFSRAIFVRSLRDASRGVVVSRDLSAGAALPKCGSFDSSFGLAQDDGISAMKSVGIQRRHFST